MIRFKTLNITLVDGTSSAEESIDIPSGTLVAIGAVVKGDTDDKIINLGLYNNGTEELTPSDLSFYEKTNGGHWLHSMRPVEITGGRKLDAKLTAASNITAGDVNVQVLFVIDAVN